MFYPGFLSQQIELRYWWEPIRELLAGRVSLFDIDDVLENQVYGDTLTSRIAVALYTLESFLMGDPIRYLFGYRLSMDLINIGPGCHVGYVNWLVENGFLTFIIAMSFFALVWRSLKTQRGYYSTSS